MRYPLYAWAGGCGGDDCPDDCTRPEHARIHLWAKDGDERVDFLDNPDDYGGITAGVNMRMDLFDELVVCRFAELVTEGRLDETFRRVLDPDSAANGNFGSYDLLEALGDDPVGKWRAAIEEAKAKAAGDG